jgi:glycosyltransferase 2 family protein
MRKKALGIAKLVLSMVLIWYLLHKIPVQNILDSLAQVNYYWLILALALAGLGKVISCFRWRYLLSVQDIQVPFAVLFCSLLVGYFFNNFLPSTIGGDAIRAFDVGRYSRRNMASFVTVITERVLGILALSVIALMAALLGFNLIRSTGQVLLMVIAFFAVSISGFFILTNRIVVEKAVTLLARCKLNNVAKKINDAYAAFRFMRDRRGALRNAFLISALLQVNVLVYYYVISLSLHLGVSLFYFFCIIPVVLLILQLPISINGIGVREGLYVFFLGLVGVAGSEAIAFSWIDFGMTIVMGLSGGVVFALRKNRPAPGE